MKRQSRLKASIEPLVLSLTILLGLIGFAVHILWVLAFALTALLWGVARSEVSRRRRGASVAEVVSRVIDASGRGGAGVSEAAAAASTADPRPGPFAPSNMVAAATEPTKKELYEEARDAGIEGRSSTYEDDLRQALYQALLSRLTGQEGQPMDPPTTSDKISGCQHSRDVLSRTPLARGQAVLRPRSIERAKRTRAQQKSLPAEIITSSNASRINIFVRSLPLCGIPRDPVQVISATLRSKTGRTSAQHSSAHCLTLPGN